MEKIRTVKVCPICKSKNLVLDTAAITGKWRCLDCNYVGVLIIEREDKA